ncbi:MAG: arsenate reductase ArsC [candidate division KSB1 bacterium]|nr:arsenate reductase ArsC [candidate division KSB1 bacterium]
MPEDRKRVLILCTGNSCRSQMAEAFLRQMRPTWEVYSAGTQPAAQVHPSAVAAMREAGIDISQARPKSVDEFLNQSFDYVITVCDQARESCPVFFGEVKESFHFGFEDPAAAVGTAEEVMAVFRKVRDQIRQAFERFVQTVDPADLEDA